MVLWKCAILVAGAVAALGCGGNGMSVEGRDGSAVDGQPIEPGRVTRATLAGNYTTSVEGQGFDLRTLTVVNDPRVADFHLTITVVVSLIPSQPMGGLCSKRPEPGAPGFTRVEDVPSGTEGCEWRAATLAGNAPDVIRRQLPGQAYLVKNRDGAVVAKLLIISASAQDADVAVTFDLATL